MTRNRPATAPPSGSGQRRHLLRDEGGSGLVEFAISALLLYTLLFGIMDCSRALYLDHFLASAAREGTRFAMVRGQAWNTSCASVTSFSCTATSANVQTYVQGLASAGIKAASITVTTTWSGNTATGVDCSPSYTNSQGCVVTVQLSYPFTFISPLLPKTTYTMTSTAASTISQ